MGNIGTHHTEDIYQAVHPHWRGEHKTVTGVSCITSGSSPLAWGTLLYSQFKLHFIRFIPTGVGNIIAPATPVELSAVHPHWRGEHHFKDFPVMVYTGSSPLAWGTSTLQLYPMILYRFIPTGVGNMSMITYMILQISVHPHWRGEHFFPSARLGPEFGSSPLAWGTFGRGVEHEDGTRFIPTGVGNIDEGEPTGNLLSVHPHWRGEHDSLNTFNRLFNGSSPLAWGTWR